MKLLGNLYLGTLEENGQQWHVGACTLSGFLSGTLRVLHSMALSVVLLVILSVSFIGFLSGSLRGLSTILV